MFALVSCFNDAAKAALAGWKKLGWMEKTGTERMYGLKPVRFKASAGAERKATAGPTTPLRSLRMTNQKQEHFDGCEKVNGDGVTDFALSPLMP